MARRKHYNFEKRQKELKREKKNEAKMERQRLKKKAAAVAGGQLEAGTDAAGGESVGEVDRDHAGDPEPG